MREVRFALRYIKKYLPSYFMGIVALFTVDFCNTYIPQYLGMITDGLEDGTINMQGVVSLIGMILLMAFLITLGRFGWRFFIIGPARRIERDIRNDLFGHLETLSQHYYNENKTGDLMARFTNDLLSVRELMGMTVITVFDASVLLIMVVYKMISYVDPRLTLVAGIPMILIIFGDVIFGKVMHARYLDKQNAFSDLSDQTQESVSGIRVIKAFVQERREMVAFAKTNMNNKDKNLRVVMLMALVYPLLDTTIGIVSLLTLIYGGYLAIIGDISVGQFVAFNSYIGMLVWPMIAVGECINSLSRGLASLRRVVDVMVVKPEIVDGEGVKDITSLKGEITFDRLSFAYPGTEGREVLKDISLHVPAGSSLAIVGRTGSGKSTMVSVLTRLYDTFPGMIKVDGHPIETIPLATLRTNIALVPQNAFLFSDSIANNIGFGVDHPTREQIEEAAKCACIHDNIMEFPQNYDTVIGERGATISGGQKQRTSIARAILKDAPVLILDDSLSAVDTDTEEQILRNLKEKRSGKTTIMIAHRISTIQHCDRILVLEDGAMAEYGTHDELMEKHGIYRGIWEKQQLEKFLAEEGDEQA